MNEIRGIFTTNIVFNVNGEKSVKIFLIVQFIHRLNSIQYKAYQHWINTLQKQNPFLQTSHRETDFVKIDRVLNLLSK